MKRCIAVLLMLASAIPTWAAENDVPPIVSLRDSGYLLGDLLEETIDVTLPQGFVLDNDSLPLPGRVAPWLEVRRASAERRDASERVVVAYQIFAEVEEATRVPLPAFKLRIRDGATTRIVTVPQKSFLLSPALPPTLTDEDRELKPSPSPQELPRAGVVGRFVLAVVVAMACAFYLLWAYDRLPFFPRSPGPFARTWRQWRRAARRDLSDADRSALLRDWHAALNGAAGETIYASTLSCLFDRVPHLVPLRERIEAVFAKSWNHFYSSNDLPASDEILRLIRESAARERGVPC